MVNDTTLRLMLVLKMINGWDTVTIDVECAFLNASLDEDVYVNIPQGYHHCMESNHEQNKVLKLKKALYGLKQASRAFFLDLYHTLEVDLNIPGCYCDACAFHKPGVIVGIYVEDILAVGTNENIQEFKEKIQQ